MKKIVKIVFLITGFVVLAASQFICMTFGVEGEYPLLYLIPAGLLCIAETGSICFFICYTGYLEKKIDELQDKESSAGNQFH